MPIQGAQRYRKHQWGFQASFSSNVAASLVIPLRGAIEVNPNLEDPDVDVGSLDPILAPFAGAMELTSSLTGKLDFDNAPAYWAGLLKGNITPTGGGAAKTYTITAASLTADAFPMISDQWGDDVTTDWINAGSGIVDSGTFGFDEDLGAWDVDLSMLYARANFGGPTGGLSVDEDPNWVYGADTKWYLDTAAGSIGTTAWTDAIHGIQIEVNGNNDQKRFANGSNTRFQLAGYGRGQREITITVQAAKTTETIAERQRIDDGPPALRFAQIETISPDIITGSTPYSQRIRVPVRLVEAHDAEFGNNNTGYEFVYKGRYNSTLTYAIQVVVVCAATYAIT